MKYGDILLFKPKDLKGKLIAYITGSQFSHAGMALFGNQFIEANPKGIRISNLMQIKDREYYLCELCDSHRAKLLIRQYLIKPFLDTKLHDPYDYLQIAKFILYYASFKLWKPKENNNPYVCFELVSAILEKAGIIKNVNTSLITGKDLFNYPIYKHKSLIKPKR